MDEAGEPQSIDATLREVARTRRIAAALLHGPDAAEIDDVLQDASVAALASGAPRGEAFAHWIRGAVRHLSVTVLRRRERRSNREREAARPVALPAADELAQRFALHRALLAAIEALSEPLRVAIVRRYFDDVKPREIAREQGVPLATVKTRLRRGLAQLRGALRNEWGEGYESALVVISSGGAGAAAGTAAMAAGAVMVVAKWKAALSVAAVLAIVAVATVVVLRHAAWQDAGDGALASTASASGAHNDGGAATRVADVAAARTPDPAGAATPAPGSRRARLGDRRVARLVGRVVDEQGAPCANVEVAILRPVRSELRIPFHALTPAVEIERHVTASAADGSFVFDDLVRGATFDVFASAGDGRRGRVLDVRAGIGEGPTVALQSTTSIEGVVVDARDRRPVAGATVHLRDFRSDGRQRLDTTTDGNGRFALSDVVGDHAVLFAAASDGRCSWPYSPKLRSGAKVELEIEVGLGAATEGAVVDAESGAPIPDAAVLLQSLEDVVATRTDEAGTFVVRQGRVTSGNLQVIVAAEGYAPIRASLLAAASESDAPPGTNVVRLPRATKAVGRLVARDDAPIAGAIVVAVREGDPSGAAGAQLAATGADGSFRMEGLDPRVRHVLQIRGEECAWTSLPFPPTGDDGHFDFGSIVVETGALVTGSVACDDGTPLAGAHVDAVSDDVSSGTALRAQLVRPGVVDAAGHFEVANLAAGRWTLRLSANGFPRPGELSLDVRRDEVVDDVKLTIGAGLSIAGRVVDARGEPVDHASLMLLRQKQNPRDLPRPVASATTDAAGRFRIGGLERGAFTLDVTPPRPGEGKSVFTELARVEAGAPDLEIVLPDGQVVSGCVVDGQGAPVAGASLVLVEANGAKVASGFTGRDGGFRLLAARPAGGVEWSLAVRISDRDHPGPLFDQAPAATVDHVRGDGPPLTIVVRGN